MPDRHALRLMYHQTPLPDDIARALNVNPIHADLADPRTLGPAVNGVDIIVHFAGVLFAPRPERFLHETNTRWFSNLLAAALEAQVGRVILISFPHSSPRPDDSIGSQLRSTPKRASRRSGFLWSALTEQPPRR
jgi:nucleoside-diphosphate-sugar epimerase